MTGREQKCAWPATGDVLQSQVNFLGQFKPVWPISHLSSAVLIMGEFFMLYATAASQVDRINNFSTSCDVFQGVIPRNGGMLVVNRDFNPSQRSLKNAKTSLLDFS